VVSKNAIVRRFRVSQGDSKCMLIDRIEPRVRRLLDSMKPNACPRYRDSAADSANDFGNSASISFESTSPEEL
jgi:hypothetical protein